MKKFYLFFLSVMFLIPSFLFSAGGKILLIADFNKGEKPSNIGGDFGSWEKDPSDKTQSCIISFSKDTKVGDKGYSLRIDYDVESENPAWNGAWFKLNGIDVSKYKKLNLYIKGDKKRGFTKVIKLELKNEKGQVGKFYITDISEKWEKYSIPLDKFIGITDFSKMKEFVIVFEDIKTTKKTGTIYIDNIYFSK